MSLEDVPRCQHVKVNGTQCGSPAMRRKRCCYFHEGARAEGVKLKTDPYAKYEFDMPLLEDANAVQVALMRVMQMLASGHMDFKKAGLLLYGLQTASANLKNTKFEAAKVTDVVIDSNTVEQTCLNGPQWFAQDFAEQDQPEPVEEDETDKLAKANGEEVLGVVEGPAAPEQGIENVVSLAPVVREKIRPEKVGALKRKRPGAAGVEDGPPSLARILLERMGLPVEDLAPASGSR
jgi:hypothetical protein